MTLYVAACLFGARRKLTFFDTSSQTHRLMPLKFRPTGHGSGIYKDQYDYNVFSGDPLIGRILRARHSLGVVGCTESDKCLGSQT